MLPSDKLTESQLFISFCTRPAPENPRATKQDGDQGSQPKPLVLTGTCLEGSREWMSGSLCDRIVYSSNAFPN